MNYYFFPKIEGLESSVTLVNFPCQERFPIRDEIQKVYVTWSDGKNWHYRVVGKIAPHEAIEFHHSDLPENIPDSPFMFFHYKDLPLSSAELIVSDHMYFMPTWRGNIKIYSEHTATSYEGDYQHEMVVHIKKGSLVSLSPMFQNHPEIKNKFIFVNMTLSPEIREHLLHFVDPKRGVILHTTQVYNNSCNIISLDTVEIPTETPVLAISNSIAGIPIYFSHSPDMRQLSFEHTHPPASLVVFGEGLYFQRKFKDDWLKKILG